jgi:hypothetical protein
MYAFFYKNIPIVIPNKVGKCITNYGILENNQFKGLAYYEVEYPELFNILKPKYRKDFELSLLCITNNEILPHTDSDVSMCINFYLQTGDAKTYFYTGGSKKYQIENQTDGFIWDKSDLKEVFSFQAIPGDIWALNVKEIHSVTCYKNEPRLAYSLSSNKINFTTDVFM